MIGATTSALLGQAVWGYLVWGLPAAVLLSSVWTHFSMDRTLAEVHLRAGQAALRSVYDVLRDRALDWKPIFNVRTTSWHIELSIGRTTYELRNTDWPAFDRLGGVARRAFHPEGSTSPE